MKCLCPHCESKTVIRTSQPINPLLRQLTFQCQDPECGHTFMAWLEVYCTLSLSAKPNPLVYLPMSEAARRQALQHPTLTSAWRKASVSTPIEPQQATGARLKARNAASDFPARDPVTTAFFSPSDPSLLAG